MFISAFDGIIFGAIATFVIGVFTSVITKAHLNNMKSNKSA